MIAWSYSRLKVFEQCRRKFQLQFITKEVPFVENLPMREGKRKHDILERATKILVLDRTKPLPESDVSHVYPMLYNFVCNHTAVKPELELAFRRDLSICKWFAKDTWLRVKIDLIGTSLDLAGSPYAHQNGIVSVLDWKSGKVRVDLDQLRLYNIAGLLYNDSIWESRAALVFIDQKQCSKIVATKRSDLQAELEEFSDRSEAIQIAAERDSWPAQQNMYCKWCGANVLQCEYAS